jgi:hypothetical protein
MTKSTIGLLILWFFVVGEARIVLLHGNNQWNPNAGEFLWEAEMILEEYEFLRVLRNYMEKNLGFGKFLSFL